MLSTTGDPAVLETIAATVPEGASIELDFEKFFSELFLEFVIAMSIPPNFFINIFIDHTFTLKITTPEPPRPPTAPPPNPAPPPPEPVFTAPGCPLTAAPPLPPTPDPPIPTGSLDLEVPPPPPPQ
jgi:hypothetical protein